jgi:REP element-mobilizing transposase RayT
MGSGSLRGMRTPRIKVPSAKAEASYHCISRIVGAEFLLKDDLAKNVLRKQLWQTADACGLQILTYAILSNHFHVLVRVPQTTAVSDAELLRRHKILHPKPTAYQLARTEVIEAQLKTGGPEADAWRKRQLSLMNDLSQFMKLVKQRFSMWYNRTHQRTGTLWSERFKSVLVEGKGNGRAMETMSAYIDLNCVRAGLCDDPKDDA